MPSSPDAKRRRPIGFGKAEVHVSRATNPGNTRFRRLRQQLEAQCSISPGGTADRCRATLPISARRSAAEPSSRYVLSEAHHRAEVLPTVPAVVGTLDMTARRSSAFRLLSESFAQWIAIASETQHSQCRKGCERRRCPKAAYRSAIAVDDALVTAGGEGFLSPIDSKSARRRASKSPCMNAASLASFSSSELSSTRIFFY